MAVFDVCSGVKMSADRPDRDRSGRPVSIRVGLSVRERLRKHSWRCYVLDSSLACVILYTCPIVVTASCRTSGLFIYVRLMISLHGCFTAVTIRHEPSQLVVARANLATRLRSSRSINFFRGRCTLPEVHFRYPFSRHDFRCNGRDSR